MTTRARFDTHNDDGLTVHELTWADYLALAGLDPITGPDAPATQLTLTDSVTPTTPLNNGHEGEKK